MQITTKFNKSTLYAGMWFITKLLDTNANHNCRCISYDVILNVIHHEITWYECKSQLNVDSHCREWECDSSRNYLIRMQITTRPDVIWCELLMWFITKLLDTNANHNPVLRDRWPAGNVIHHEITWYECKSQQLFSSSYFFLKCDSSRNYLIRMQITTHQHPWAYESPMWFITKLLDTNANHNQNIASACHILKCDSSRNYLIRMQITTAPPFGWTSIECDSSRNYLIRMQITTGFCKVFIFSVMWFITKLLDTNANHN